MLTDEARTRSVAQNAFLEAFSTIMRAQSTPEYRRMRTAIAARNERRREILREATPVLGAYRNSRKLPENILVTQPDSTIELGVESPSAGM